MESFDVFFFILKTFGSAAFRHQVHFSELHINLAFGQLVIETFMVQTVELLSYQQTSLDRTRFGEEIRKIQGVEGFRQKWRTWIWRIDGLWRVINPHLLGGGDFKHVLNFHPEKLGEDEPHFAVFFLKMGWSHQSVIIFKMSSWPLRIVIVFSSSSYWNLIQYLSRQFFTIYDFPSKLLIFFLENLFLSSRNVNLLRLSHLFWSEIPGNFPTMSSPSRTPPELVVFAVEPCRDNQSYLDCSFSKMSSP